MMNMDYSTLLSLKDVKMKSNKDEQERIKREQGT